MNSVIEPPPHAHHGPGRRLLEAIEALESFPAVAEAHRRTIAGAGSCTGELTDAVQTDVALTLAVLREANRVKTGRKPIAAVADGIHLLGGERVAELAAAVPSSDFFRSVPGFGVSADAFRLHAVAVQRMATVIASELDWERCDELLPAALLHDVGKLLLAYLYGGMPAMAVPDGPASPEERILRERRTFGFDHATIGGVVLRRLGLPGSLAAAVEGHHNGRAVGQAAVLRLADVLVHYQHGGSVTSRALLEAAQALGLTLDRLRGLMYGLPSHTEQATGNDPSPFTRQEFAVLKRFAEGWSYKEIAAKLDRSPSTVRSHLHSIYSKLQVSNGAHAVLLATNRGWIQPTDPRIAARA